MATATLNWTFGQVAGRTPVVSCTFTVQVTRDGSTIGSFSVTTSPAGIASGVYYDNAASASQTHSYQFTPQMTGCATGCLVAPVMVNWNCAGTAQPPIGPTLPPPPPPPANCPSLGDDFSPAPVGYFCGGTVVAPQAVVGTSYVRTQSFANATSITGTTNAPGLSASALNGTTFQVSGTPTTPGSYTAVFTASKANCPDCVVTHTIQISSTGCATQSLQILRGSSAYTPPTPSSFNAADQVFEYRLIGPPGKTFELVGVGTVSTTSPVQTIPPSGIYTISIPTAQWTVYSTTWTAQSAGSNPVTICNPAPVLITGSTALTLTLSKTGSTFSAIVTAPPGASGVPFTLSFGGGGYGGSNDCTANAFGVTQTSSTGSSGGNTYEYGPITVSSTLVVAIKLATTAASALTHVVTGAACQQITVP